MTTAGSTSVAEMLEMHYGDQLSNRELEIGRLAISGMSTQDIAEQTYLTVNTVKTHLKNLFRKTKTENRNDLYRKLVSLQFPNAVGKNPEADAGTREPSALQKAAKRDPATGLLHPFSFQALFQSTLHQVRTNPVSLIRVAFNAGSKLEDSGGLTPEQGPIALASVLLTSVRASDMIFRWGDFEFVFLLPNCSLIITRDIAGRLIQKAHALAQCRNVSINTTIGLSSTEEGWKTADALLDAAGQRVSERPVPFTSSMMVPRHPSVS